MVISDFLSFKKCESSLIINYRFLQEQFVVQVHTYITIALNPFIKFNFEDPLEKRFKKPTVLDERLNGFLEGAGERYQSERISDEALLDPPATGDIPVITGKLLTPIHSLLSMTILSKYNSEKVII